MKLTAPISAQVCLSRHAGLFARAKVLLIYAEMLDCLSVLRCWTAYLCRYA